MGLFQKKPAFEESRQYYTLGLQKTLLIVGLGNVGEKYDGTRHNIGFTCIDRFVHDQRFPDWVSKKDLKCLQTSQTLGDSKIIVIKPTTFMNLSGQAVQATAAFYKISPQHIVVVHDELDIPFGQIRCRVGGSSAGHNGIKSVSEVMGEDYGRVRIGIGPKVPEQIDSADFVLGAFNPHEQAQLKNLTREVSAILSEFAYGGQLAVETRSFIVED